MNCDTNGVTAAEYRSGLVAYGTNVRGVPPTSSANLGSTSATFTQAESYIKSNYPFGVFLAGDPYYRYHIVTCFGTEYNTDGQYLRIANGWDRSYQNWYLYKGSITNYMYARWN